MANYTAIGTCAAIGENFAITLPLEAGLVRMPFLSSADVEFHLGGDTDWDQRRAFEWGLLGCISRRNGDEATAAYCASRVASLAAARAA
jgi:hypothetical protein